jgi:Ca-activated chloride channel homolog
MNKTTIFLVGAAVLGVVALVVAPKPANPLPTNTPTNVPTPTQIAPIIPAPLASSTGSISMTGRLSHPLVAIGSNDVFVTVDMKGAAFPGSKRNPVNLALVIDRSGSMSGNKINQAKQAAKVLVNQLSENDRLTIIHYGSDVKSLEGMTGTNPNKQRMNAYIDGIWDDGGTNISAGLDTGIAALLKTGTDYKVNRMILISDGQPTEGLVDAASLQNIIRRARQSNISVSSLGVGLDFNESLMASLAEIGAGAYGFIENSEMLASIFAKDLNAAASQVASGVELQFQVPANVKYVEVFGRTARLSPLGDMQLVSISLPDFAAEQVERVVAHVVVEGHSVNETTTVANLTLNYFDLKTEQRASETGSLAAVTSNDVKVILEKQDREAMLFATRAKVAKNTERANEMLERGDRDGARAAIQESAGMFDGLRNVFGMSADSLAGDTASVQGSLSGLENAKDAESMKRYRKSEESKKMKNFGAEGSTY